MRITAALQRWGFRIGVAAVLVAAAATLGWSWASWWQAWPGYVLALLLLAAFAVRWMPIWPVCALLPAAFTAGFAVPFLTAEITTGLWGLAATVAFAALTLITPAVTWSAKTLWRTRAANRGFGSATSSAAPDEVVISWIFLYTGLVVAGLSGLLGGPVFLLGTVVGGLLAIGGLVALIRLRPSQRSHRETDANASARTQRRHGSS